MSKIEVINDLLDAQHYALSDWNQEQYAIWSYKVEFALNAAGMNDDLEIWRSACEKSRYTYSERDLHVDPTFVAHVESMTAILKGIRERLREENSAEPLFSLEFIKNTKNYVMKLATEINGCYESGYIDACAVLIRRLVEILIIDCFEKHQIRNKIEDTSGNYFGLERLIDTFLAETTWHISKPLKRYLPKLKELKNLGDQAAHGINITPKNKIDRLYNAIINTYQGLVDLAYS